eukprot:377041_1
MSKKLKQPKQLAFEVCSEFTEGATYRLAGRSEKWFDCTAGKTTDDSRKSVNETHRFTRCILSRNDNEDENGPDSFEFLKVYGYNGSFIGPKRVYDKGIYEKMRYIPNAFYKQQEEVKNQKKPKKKKSKKKTRKKKHKKKRKTKQLNDSK